MKRLGKLEEGEVCVCSDLERLLGGTGINFGPVIEFRQADGELNWFHIGTEKRKTLNDTVIWRGTP